ncbi:c-type cytochrome [Tabrizicola sp. J26]|uniref:cytochrome c n=1 Tax=Alitabrizicola rongguiensis TaxID=2909234 RepID=UPI001F1A11CA|nr:c-type cytochrome [Tabrizicola rongguiensis]MCF1709809.1 c-type cytochrome [Tabrizicola rongguiensis]
MKRVLLGLVLVAACVAAFVIVTLPERGDAVALGQLSGDPARGQTLFWAGGCASCHAAPGAEGEARLVLSGGLQLPTPFGTFSVPNISPDPLQGIGNWTLADFEGALRHGTSPDGKHYYPSFPYTSYAHATDQDVVDLWAFLQTLPLSNRPNDPHQISFPFDQRLLLGGWKFLNPSTAWVVPDPLTPEEERGRYLVEGFGHCGECHTPRNALGGRDMARWLAGGPNPEGKGTIPNITPAKLDWSTADIAEYLKSGFTPDYDSAGGGMADVVTNISHLSDADRLAIAAYLKKVPPQN